VNKPGEQQQRTDSTNNSMFRIKPSAATPSQIRRWRAHYYANISLIDEGIGKMLTALEAHGVLDDTMIVFTLDHGDALGDHGLSYKGFFYESMAHVPLVVRGPGGQQGARCPSVVSGLDVIALFYEVFGVAPHETLQAVSPAPMMRDPTTSTRDAVFCEISGRVMVCDGRWKYVHYATGKAELYDLQQQPQEVDNLTGRAEYAAHETRLRGRLLEHWLKNQSQQQIPTRQPQHPFRVALEEDYRRQHE
jgi:arylsulfatase A-like enzyme